MLDDIPNFPDDFSDLRKDLAGILSPGPLHS